VCYFIKGLISSNISDYQVLTINAVSLRKWSVSKEDGYTNANERVKGIALPFVLNNSAKLL